MGLYREISLAEARDRREEARKQLAHGVDPSAARQAQRPAAAPAAAEKDNFEAVAREWLGQYGARWVDSYRDHLVRRLERDVFAWLGARPIAQISAPELLVLARRIADRGALETAHRVLQTCGQIFRYAVATGRAERDTTADLRGALPLAQTGNMAAITEPPEVGALLRAIDGYRGSLTVRCALRLAPLVFVRPGELRHAAWDDIDLESAEWLFVVSKTRQDPIVPLARQAIEVLREIYPLTRGGRYVFPNARSPRGSRPMSDAALLVALRNLGFEQTQMSVYGFRAIARTLLDEQLHIRPDLIEHQLGHAVRDPLGRAHNRTTFLDDRREMMQSWADYLDALRGGTDKAVAGLDIERNFPRPARPV